MADVPWRNPLSRQPVMLSVVVVLIGLVAVGVHSEEPPQFIPSPYDKMLLDLDEQAINEAYKLQVQNLFAVWMKDDKDQPRRAVVGVQHARTAFIAAMAEIRKRRQLLLPKND